MEKLKKVKSSLKKLLSDPKERERYLEELEHFRITLKILGQIEKSGITISELARRMKTSRSQVRRMLSLTKLHRYNIKTLQKFARALNLAVSVDFVPEEKFLEAESVDRTRQEQKGWLSSSRFINL